MVIFLSFDNLTKTSTNYFWYDFLPSDKLTGSMALLHCATCIAAFYLCNNVVMKKLSSASTYPTLTYVNTLIGKPLAVESCVRQRGSKKAMHDRTCDVRKCHEPETIKVYLNTYFCSTV
jgi:hypothetical protein